MRIGQAGVTVGRRNARIGRPRDGGPGGVSSGYSPDCCVLTAAAAGIPQLHVSPSRSAERHSSTVVPSALVPQLSASIGASQRSFWPVRDGDSFRAHGAGIQSSFSASGAELGVGSRNARALPGRRRPGRAPRTGRRRRSRSSLRNEVLYRHGSLTQFYRNGPYGLEQGFTLKQRPQAGSGPLVLTLSLDGSLTPKQIGSQIIFSSRAGQTALRYGQLSAVDATGRQLPARLRLSGGTLQLVIDDNHARYPVRIDPFVQQGEKLTGAGEIGEGEFGESVALSGDGDTALVGAPKDVHGGEFSRETIGGAWVFTRSGSTWTQGERLVTGGVYSVALSGDGDTALIGPRRRP